MGKNKKCEEIKDINRNMFIVLGLLCIGFGLSISLGSFKDIISFKDIVSLYNAKIFYKDKKFYYVVCIIVFIIVLITIGILFLIKYGDGTIWINEDEYKKMKCKDL